MAEVQSEKGGSMGRYFNPTNTGFRKALASEIYIDKSEMIEYLNSIIGGIEPLVCVSRPRRFGKSMAVNMLTAYYSRGCDSQELFDKLKISHFEDYKKHLNQYNVLRIDMQWMIDEAIKAVKYGRETIIFRYVQKQIIKELCKNYPQIVNEGDYSLPEVLQNIYDVTEEQFIIIIDEWDCVFRNNKTNKELQIEYIEMLRGLFKGVIAEESIALAYLTGILPIKKYGTESALNNFKEFTMTEPKQMAEYVGFTEGEVKMLCTKFHMNFEEMKRWYDGYYFKDVGNIYNPRSVVEASLSEKYGGYWTSTETYESLKNYIIMNFDGLKDSIVTMIGGNRCKIDIRAFQNDMVSLKSKDDVMTLLVHLGYLAYYSEKEETFIPNEEVRTEFILAVKNNSWIEVIRAIEQSEELLKATLDGNEKQVARCLEYIHMDTTSILNYNDENALSCVVSLAYYSARKDYIFIREMPTGKGFADIVFVPRKYSDKPALIIELKWNDNAETAISQIKEKKYVRAIQKYTGDILLVGINYDKTTKVHCCKIEKYRK